MGIDPVGESLRIQPEDRVMAYEEAGEEDTAAALMRQRHPDDVHISEDARKLCRAEEGASSHEQDTSRHDAEQRDDAPRTPHDLHDANIAARRYVAVEHAGESPLIDMGEA